MITKLKYVGVSQQDLLDIYILFIRSVVEYCSVSFHSSLTQDQTNKLERIQKTCLKVILGEEYEDYKNALKISNLDTLSDRRLKRCLDFSLKCLEHPENKIIFPRNPYYNRRIRKSEPFKVNFANIGAYQCSTVPFCQELLNEHFQ